MNTQATVYIIDDDASVLNGISKLIRSEGYSTQTFASGREFLDHGCVEPGCIIMDLAMPDMTGLEAQQALLAQGLHAPIIFLSANGSIPSTVKALKSGAFDFLEKPVDAEVLIRTINNALEIEHINRKQMHNIADANARLGKLTAREREVLQYVIAGSLNKQIAYELNISEKTVKVHRARVMEKMAVHSVAELVRLTEKLNVQPIDTSISITQ